MIFKICTEIQLSWPKLAWVAVLPSVSKEVRILHGPMVEARNDWVVEAIWAGSFEDGDFDRTDLVFGSGVRLRNDQLVFVSSATGVDRLWHVKHGEKVFVANTLPGLLKVSGLSLRQEYPHYTRDIESIEHKGLLSYVKEIPSSGPNISVAYYINLLWSNGFLKEIDKPDQTPSFSDFSGYKSFLQASASKLGENTRAATRIFPVDMLVGLSSGYDSAATAVVSKYAGCRKAVSIVNPSSWWRGSDSGKHIAKRLGMECRLYKHASHSYRHEITMWAGAGSSGGRNLTLFDYPEPLCVFFSGMYGDTIWNRHKQGLLEPKGDADALTCEFRLVVGSFVCPVPWWGILKAKEIQRINQLAEMQPWTLGTNYDRPIARRLVEEAGVPRGEFAVRKKDTASTNPLRWPASSVASESLKQYLRGIGITVPSCTYLRVLEILSYILNLTYKNTIKRLGIKKWWRPWLTFAGREQLFIWANHTLRDTHYDNS